MMTIKELMESRCQSSPDGKHWEPALPEQASFFKTRFRDAWSVWKGEATAIRQTTKADLLRSRGEA